MDQPEVLYPTCVFGFVQGPVRLESLDGSEAFTDGGFHIIKDHEPKLVEGKVYAIAHQQKLSHIGFLWMKPFCLHWWLFPQLQKKCAHGGWVPGSEFGKYFRFGKWRWDPKGTVDKVTGVLLHWIKWSVYINFSFHWD